MTDRRIEAEPWHLDVVRAILAEHVPPGAQVWVFGSRARPDAARRGSDLDLAIDAGQPLGLHREAMLAEAFSDSDLPYRVDVVDWHSAAAPFRATVSADRVMLSPIEV